MRGIGVFVTAVPENQLQELLADARWVRSLARSLARGGIEADDLAQDACLAALQSPPAHGTNVRGWFQRVLGNLVLQQHRTATRRRRREEAVVAERAAAEVPADELVERAQVHRAVVDAVLALEPPYREAMLLRWFEEQPPRAIAARTGVSVATVNSRLQRGAALLRARLDRRHGTRAAWAGACASLPATWSLPLVGVVVMNVKAVAAGAVLAIGAAVWWASGSSADPKVSLPNGPAPSTTASASAGTAQPTSGTTRVDSTPAAAAGGARRGDAPAAVPRQLAGRVVDGEGRHATGVVVQCGEAKATSGADGTFTLGMPVGQSGLVRADDARWRTVLHGIVAPEGDAPLAVVVGAALDLAGQVRSSDGSGVRGARVQVQWPSDLRNRLSLIGDQSSPESHSAGSDAEGHFRLGSAAVRGATMLVTADGYLPSTQPLPERSSANLQILLERPVAKVGSIQGLVLDDHGAPVAGARVGLGGAVQRTDERGMFLIDDDKRGGELAAVATGHRRAVVKRAGDGFPPFVTLALGGAPRTIRGRVVDQEGAGLAAAKVWVTDPTLLCQSREPMAVEGLSCGAITVSELRERFERGDLKDPAQAIRTTATAGWPWVLTGADGTFTLGGLEDRAYSLRAMDDETLTRVDLANVVAGAEDVRLVLPTRERFEKVAGVVVTRTGRPVPGVRIAVQTDTIRVGTSTMHAQAVARTTSDADGRFVLSKVPHRAAYLRLDGDTILPLEFGRGVDGGLFEALGGNATDVRLVVAARLHVQVELLDVASADALRVLDGSGREVSLTVFEGRSRNDTPRLTFVAGRSPVFVVPDGAATLVLEKDEKEVRRELLSLQPGPVNTLRL
ncbi:MAG: sigma-70 family RNA polymerase sigma factor [Planctomycetes bacterium]|nr:sigma-70 family RNA polymerase sigma factor [Planctomycetota bacterium]